MKLTKSGEIEALAVQYAPLLDDREIAIIRAIGEEGSFNRELYNSLHDLIPEGLGIYWVRNDNGSWWDETCWEIITSVSNSDLWHKTKKQRKRFWELGPIGKELLRMINDKIGAKTEREGE